MRNGSIRALPRVAMALLLTACSDGAVEPAAPRTSPVRALAAAAPAAPRDRYIVVFRDDVRAPLELADRLAAEHGATAHYRWEHGLKGFAATFPSGAVEGLRRNPNVRYVEPDQVVELTTVQSNAPWGLDRVDQTTLPLNGTFGYNYDGTGVNAYVIDSGIETTHPEFEGRARVAYDAMTDGRNGQDCYGHGTHVAGILGSRAYGMAKKVTLHSVRVFDCNGSPTGSGLTSTMVTGVNWVTANRVRPAVANMSFRLRDPNRRSYALDDAVIRMINNGVIAVAGAGQTQVSTGTTPGEDACVNSPARVGSVLTVGATSANDSRVINGVSRGVIWTSNYGSCIDLFAPGDQIRSTYLFSSAFTMGGTSMATPFVAGLVARYLQWDPTASSATVRNYVVSWASDAVQNAGTDSPVKLLYAPPFN